MTPRLAFFFAAAVGFCASVTAHASPLRVLENQSLVTLHGSDDDSTEALALGFSLNLFGVSYSDLYLNNNGNVTFAFPSGLGNPSSAATGLAEQGGPVLAPFLADVDTTYVGALAYGAGTIGLFNAFTATWVGVAAYGSGLAPEHLNTFQLFLVDRSDTGAGNFDFEFNYEQIQWDQGANGTGVAALAGFSDAGAANFLIEGSGESGAFLDDTGAHALRTHWLGSPFDDAVMAGRYAFSVRNGAVNRPDGGGGNTPAVPESSTSGALVATMLALMTSSRWCRRRRASDAALHSIS